MTRYLCAIVAIVALAGISRVYAQATATEISDSGSRYAETCSSIEKPSAQWSEMDALNVGTCSAYMVGLRDGMTLILFMGKEGGISPQFQKGTEEDLGICIPDGVETGQMIRITLKYIRENPEQAHIRSAQLVLAASQHAYPCGPGRATAKKP
jgi:hypothetical protein